MRASASFIFPLLLLAQGCGIGLCVRDGICSGAATITAQVEFFVNSLSLRRNDCVQATVRATDGGQPLGTPLTVTLSVSSGKAYSTLKACQIYQSSLEVSSVDLEPPSSSEVVYVRPDSSGTLTLSAASGSATVQSGQTQVSVTADSFSSITGPNYRGVAIASASGGKLYVGGEFTTWDDTKVSYIARATSDGTLDPTFLPTGTGLSGQVYAIVVNSDDSVYVAGFPTTYNGTLTKYVAKLKADGSLDASFAPVGGGLNSMVYAIAKQSDGKLVVGGSFTNYNGTSAPRVARLNTDGSLDTSFAPTGTGLNGSVSAIAIQSDGMIVVGGTFVSYNGTSRPYVARLASDGSLDVGFATTGTGLNNSVSAIAIQADGKIIVGGSFLTYNGASMPAVARLNSDGTLDGTFVQTGTGIAGTGQSLSIQSDGKILVTGVFGYNLVQQRGILRLNSDGTLDSSFSAGAGANLSINSVAILDDGRLALTGDFTQYDGHSAPFFARITSTGAFDNSISPGVSGFDSQVYSLAVFQDKTLVAGSFRSYGTTPTPYLARFNADGSLDTSFAQTGSGLNSSANSVVTQNDGKIVVGGSFSVYDGTVVGTVARLNSDGSLDTGFLPTGTGLGFSVNCLAIQSDGKILAGGSFTSYNGVSRPYMARLNSNGTLDTSFVQTGTGLNGPVNSVSVQSDGKILVGGSFTSYNAVSQRYVARLNSDGSLDGTFAPTGTGLSSFVSTVYGLSDGKVLVGGSFTSYNGTSARRVARLNTDGSLDTSFALTGTGLNSLVSSIMVQDDGQLLITGAFGNYNGTSVSKIARLNPDGSLDTSMAPTGTGPDFTVVSAAFQSDSKIVIGGSFMSFNTQSARYCFRITYSGAAD